MEKAGLYSLMHDGWTKYGTHYLCMIVSFYLPLPGGEVDPKSRLVALSPIMDLGKSPDGSEDTDVVGKETEMMEEATSFSAKITADHIYNTLSEYYVEDVDSTLVCLVGDNTNVNPATATQLGKFHICCHSHLLNSETQNYVSTDKNVSKASSSL